MKGEKQNLVGVFGGQATKDDELVFVDKARVEMARSRGHQGRRNPGQQPGPRSGGQVELPQFGRDAARLAAAKHVEAVLVAHHGGAIQHRRAQRHQMPLFRLQVEGPQLVEEVGAVGRAAGHVHVLVEHSGAVELPRRQLARWRFPSPVAHCDVAPVPLHKIEPP